MKSIFVLTITQFDNYEEVEDQFDMYFSTLEKAQNFIINNFTYDNVRKLTNEHYEGKRGNYSISCDVMIDQERL